MSASLKPQDLSLDVEAFLEWTLDQPGDRRYELLDGVPVAQSLQTFGHADAKFRIAQACDAEIAAKGLPCRVILDGMGVRASSHRVFIPDVMVHCGGAIDPDARILDDPLVAIEVMSRSTRHIDLSLKLLGYFSRPSLRHYLIVDVRGRVAIHHARDAEGAIATRIVGREPVRFDPPGIEPGDIYGPA